MASKMFQALQYLFGVEPRPASLDSINLKSLQWEPILPPAIWTWASMTAVQLQHESAIFQLSARLCDTLGRDDFISGIRQTRLLAINGLPEYFLAPDGTISEDEDLKRDWPRLFPKSTQMEVIDWVLHEGFCVTQLNYDANMVPTPQIWHPGNCFWDKSQRCWYVNTQTGTIRLVGENAPGMGKWVVFKGWIDERPWYAGIIRAVALLLLIRQTLLPEYLKYAKRAAGVYVLETDAMASTIDDVQKTVAAINKLNGGSMTHLLDGMKLSLLEFHGTAWQAYANFLQYVDNALAILYLGAPDIVSNGKNGSRSASSVKDRPRQDRLESDCTILGVGARQILQAYYFWSRGIEDHTQIPTAVWDATPPEDAVRAAEVALKRGSGAKAAAEALEKLMNVPGFDVEEYCRIHEIPMEGVVSAAAGRRPARPVNGIPGLRPILAAIAGSKDPEDMRRRVLETYRKLGPEKLARAMSELVEVYRKVPGVSAPGA